MLQHLSHGSDQVIGHPVVFLSKLFCHEAEKGLHVFIVGDILNPFPNTAFLDRPKFKEALDDNWNVAIKGFLDIDCIENIVEKSGIAHFEQFHLFLQCFLKASFFSVLKWVYMEERVNSLANDKIWKLFWKG